MFIIKSKFSRLLNKVEDPHATLDYSYEQQLASLQRLKGALVDLTTAKARLVAERTRLAEANVKLQAQAAQAIKADREDLARAALERKVANEQQLDNLTTQIGNLEAQQENLTAQCNQLSDKIARFRDQKEILKAQYTAASAQVRVGELVTGIGNSLSGGGNEIQRAKEQIEEMAARAEAMQELTESGAFEDITDGRSSIERELDRLSVGSQVDSDLARLKAELGKADERPELAAVIDIADARLPATAAETADVSVADAR